MQRFGAKMRAKLYRPGQHLELLNVNKTLSLSDSCQNSTSCGSRTPGELRTTAMNSIFKFIDHQQPRQEPAGTKPTNFNLHCELSNLFRIFNQHISGLSSVAAMRFPQLNPRTTTDQPDSRFSGIGAIEWLSSGLSEAIYLELG
jgi:hypothetical protein